MQAEGQQPNDASMEAMLGRFQVTHPEGLKWQQQANPPGLHQPQMSRVILDMQLY